MQMVSVSLESDKEVAEQVYVDILKFYIAMQIHVAC